MVSLPEKNLVMVNLKPYSPDKVALIQKWIVHLKIRKSPLKCSNTAEFPVSIPIRKIIPKA